MFSSSQHKCNKDLIKKMYDGVNERYGTKVPLPESAR